MLSDSHTVSNLIYATHGESVVLTMVDGRVVYNSENKA